MSTIPLPVETTLTETPGADPRWLEVVEHQVRALKYGSVHITVHEGHVVQIETSVRVRFEKTR